MEAILYAFDVVLMTLFVYLVYRVDKGKARSDDLGLFSFRKANDVAGARRQGR